MNRKLVVGLSLCLGGLAACGVDNDNETIRANSNNTYLLSDARYAGGGGGWDQLNFIDLSNMDAVRWVGDPGDARSYLTYLNVGSCYTNPLTPNLAKEVPCPEFEDK